jgi:hypothetical protein
MTTYLFNKLIMEPKDETRQKTKEEILNDCPFNDMTFVEDYAGGSTGYYSRDAVKEMMDIYASQQTAELAQENERLKKENAELRPEIIRLQNVGIKLANDYEAERVSKKSYAREMVEKFYKENLIISFAKQDLDTWLSEHGLQEGGERK